MAMEQEWEALELVGQIIAAAEGDPVHAILREWHEAREAEYRAVERYGQLECEHGVSAPEAERYSEREVKPTQTRLFAAYRVLARAVPTTPAGLYAQLAVAANMEWAGPVSEREPETLILKSASEAARRLVEAAGQRVN